MRPTAGPHPDPEKLPPLLKLLWSLYLIPMSVVYSINIFLVNHLPDKWALIPDAIYVRYWMGWLFGPRRILRLRKVYTKKSDQEIAELSEANFKFRIGLSAHFSRSVAAPFDVYETQNTLYGEENLQAALKEGRGVLLLQAHYGNFYGPLCLLPRRGYDVTAIGITVQPAAFETLINNVLARFGTIRSVSGQGGGKIALKALRRNGVLCAYFDVMPPGKEKESLWMPFGDSFLAIYDGPARLAVHSKVTVVPAISYLTKPFHSEIHIEPAFPMLQGANEEETIQMIIKQWMDWFEPKLMAKPEQWWSWPFITLPKKKQEEKSDS